MPNRIELKFIVLPMILALVLVLAAACSGDDDGDTTPIAPAATQPAGAAPQATTAVPTEIPAEAKPVIDKLTIGAQTPSLLSNNAGRGLAPQSQFQLVPMYEYPLGTDAVTGALIPQLAVSWKLEPNGSDFRIKLREGVPFHNGVGTLTWRDIAFTVAELGAEDSQHTHQRDYAKVTIEPISDLEFIWKLPNPVAEQVKRLSEQVGGMEVMSSADFAVLGQPLMTNRPLAGTGPYEFDTRDQNTNVRFKRAPGTHWRYQPDFDNLEIRWMDEESTRLAALLTGEIQITQIGADSTEQASQDGMLVMTGTQPGARIFGAFEGGYIDTGAASSYEQQNTPCGYVHCDSPWLNPLVREAFNKAVDKDALNTAFFRGAAQKMMIQAIPITSPAFNPAWKANYEAEYGFDPAAAKALLIEAGYGPDNPLKINVQNSPVASYAQAGDVMEVMAGYWADIGVDITLDGITAATQRADSRALNLVNWMGLTSSASFDVQSWRVHHAALSPRGGGFEPLEIHDLIAKLQLTMDTDAQDAIMREIGNIAFPLHVAVNLFWIPPQITLNPEFVESWNWPGNVSGLWSNFDLIRAHKE